MKIKNKLLFYTVFLSILTSCTSLSDAQKVLRNEKKTTDEFMVKKRESLSTPPDFEKLPVPNSEIKNDKSRADDQFSLEKIITEIDGDNPNQSSNEVEKIILNKIKN